MRITLLLWGMKEKSALQIVLETGCLKSFRDLFEWRTNYNQSTFARESGMKRDRVRKLCNSPEKIRPEEIDLVAKVLGVNATLIKRLLPTGQRKSAAGERRTSLNRPYPKKSLEP